MGDVLVQSSPHIQQTPTRRRWYHGTHNIPENRAREPAELLDTVIPPCTWPARHRDSRQLDQSPKSFQIQSTPQHRSMFEETSLKGPSKSPPSSRTSLVHSSSSNLAVSDRIKKYRDDRKQAVETPLSQRMETETPSPLGMRMQVSGDSADDFWLGASGRTSKINEPASPTPLPYQQAGFPSKFRLGIRNDEMETKVIAPVGPTTTKTDTDDDDSESSCSYSVLSNDTIESPPQPRLTRFTHDQEVSFFNTIYDILDASFSAWVKRVHYQSGQPLTLEKDEDATLSLPHIRESNVIFGLRPRRQGFWEGRLELRGEYTEVKKLSAPSFENDIGFGVEIGSIKDFETIGSAILFMGVDMQMYYTDREGWFDLDEYGRYCYPVLGPYDFRSLCRDNVLDPLPPGRAVVWGSGTNEKEGNVQVSTVM